MRITTTIIALISLLPAIGLASTPDDGPGVRYCKSFFNQHLEGTFSGHDQDVNPVSDHVVVDVGNQLQSCQSYGQGRAVCVIPIKVVVSKPGQTMVSDSGEMYCGNIRNNPILAYGINAYHGPSALSLNFEPNNSLDPTPPGNSMVWINQDGQLLFDSFSQGKFTR